MTPLEYTEAAKQKLGGISDYALAKKLDLRHGQISAFKLRKANLPNAAVFRLAITLERDPAEVLADLESQWEKHEGKAAFWRDFLSRARQPLIGVFLLLSICTATVDNAHAKPGGDALAGAAALALAGALLARRRAHNAYYVNSRAASRNGARPRDSE